MPNFGAEFTTPHGPHSASVKLHATMWCPAAKSLLRCFLGIPERGASSLENRRFADGAPRMRKAASILLLVGWSSAKPRGEDDPSSPINRLKADLHKLSFEEAKMRFGEINVRGPPPPRQNKVDHFVVLYMENHAADNFFGCMDLPGFDGIKGHKLPKDPSDPSKGTFEVTCGKADYVCKGGPGYDTFAGKFPKTGAMPHIYPYSAQSDVNSALHGATEGGVATTMYGPEQVRNDHCE